MIMNMNDIYSKIAKAHGVTAEEVKRDMQAAIDHAYTKPDKTAQEGRAQAAVLRRGETPTPEEVVAHVVGRIK